MDAAGAQGAAILISLDRHCAGVVAGDTIVGRIAKPVAHRFSGV